MSILVDWKSSYLQAPIFTDGHFSILTAALERVAKDLVT